VLPQAIWTSELKISDEIFDAINAYGRAAGSSRQFGSGRPEPIDAGHKIIELIPIRRLLQVAVRVELIAENNIGFRVGRRQDDRGNCL
jgi:hypothetical protein